MAEETRKGKDSFRLELCTVLVLQMLCKSKRYAYDLMQEISSIFGELVTFQRGTIYPVIYRMEDEGLIIAEKVSLEGTRRKERVYYRITDKGIEEYKRLSEKYIAIADILKNRLEEKDTISANAR